MTVKAYITGKFQTFDIVLSEADLLDISMSVDVEEDFTKENRDTVFLALAKTVIPQLLLRAQSVSENGFSVSYNADALLKYYAWLCGELGIEDNLNRKPKVRFL